MLTSSQPMRKRKTVTEDTALATKKKPVYSCLWASFILLLVPTGRSVQTFLNNIQIKGYKTSFLIVSLLILISYYYTLVQKHGRRWMFTHLAIATISALLIALLNPLFIELTHIFLYGTFAILLTYEIDSQDKYRQIKTILILGLALACLDEILQWIHPDRFFDLRDIAFNIGGILTGLFFIFPFQTKANKQGFHS